MSLAHRRYLTDTCLDRHVQIIIIIAMTMFMVLSS